MPRECAFDREVADQILQRMAEGEYLRKIVRSDPERFPPESTFRRWVLEDRDGLAAQYARARDLQWQAWEDRMMVVAEDSSGDEKEIEKGDGTVVTVVDSEFVRRSEIKIMTMKWLMSKLHPKRYGERVAQEVSGPEGGPLTISWLSKPPS